MIYVWIYLFLRDFTGHPVVVLGEILFWSKWCIFSGYLLAFCLFALIKTDEMRAPQVWPAPPPPPGQQTAGTAGRSYHTDVGSSVHIPGQFRLNSYLMPGSGTS